ncbi:hypothetical protein HanIR_Chr12g0576271 [Helianthus annuus]|nr:hypothetical protein HanIR_Chr12g0576271 [Helianthus annuus]
MLSLHIDFFFGCQEPLRSELKWISPNLWIVMNLPNIYKKASAFRDSVTAYIAVFCRFMRNRKGRSWIKTHCLFDNGLKIDQIVHV